jgi:hypothetical protein
MGVPRTKPAIIRTALRLANGKHQKGGKPSDEQPDRRHVSDKNHPLSRASLTEANRPLSNFRITGSISHLEMR